MTAPARAPSAASHLVSDTAAGRHRDAGRTVAEVVAMLQRELHHAGLPDARRAAHDVVAAVARQPRSWAALSGSTMLDPSTVEAVHAAGARLRSGAPFAYAVGSAAFRRLELAVDTRVLIPRPETEYLVELVLDVVHARAGRWEVAADVGTGSGAIALALASEGPFARVVGTDLSADALDVARFNAVWHAAALRARVEWRLGAGVAPLAGERLDLLVSNPPYIAFSELGALPAAVRDWEPPPALACPDDGLAVLHDVVAGAPALLRGGGLLALEVDARRAQRVVDLVRGTGAFDDILVRRDLARRDRFVLATRRTSLHA